MHRGEHAVNSKRLDQAIEMLIGRYAAGWTLRELAGQTGVGRSTLSRWVNRDRVPTGVSARALLAWAERGGHGAVEQGAERGQPTPRQSSPGVQSESHDFWRGVLYAAESHSETTTRLLREARAAYDEQQQTDR